MAVQRRLGGQHALSGPLAADRVGLRRAREVARRRGFGAIPNGAVSRHTRSPAMWFEVISIASGSAYWLLSTRRSPTTWLRAMPR